ncbi:hypothetical protein ADILRU_0333 [Leifsonia rubra CMS 76R]|nr:hypothetical protein ADILRU_0333 [Leifsonia rubra CMS 76R]
MVVSYEDVENQLAGGQTLPVLAFAIQPFSVRGCVRLRLLVEK